jgi:hypothetical protein
VVPVASLRGGIAAVLYGILRRVLQSLIRQCLIFEAVRELKNTTRNGNRTVLVNAFAEEKNGSCLEVECI